MDINHIVNNLHTPTNNFPTNISNNNNNNSITSTNLDKELSITMDDHHNHHHEYQHHNNHGLIPHISFIDQAWPTNHNLPTPHPSPSPSPPPSSYIIKSSIQDHILLDEDENHDELEEEEELGAMKEMMYRIASMQPVDIDPSSIRKPKRRNVRISNDPQSVAARHRRERISEKIRILQRLVPGGTKMDTASMLDEAIRYVKFLKRQIRQLQAGSSTTHHAPPPPCVPPFPPSDWPLPPPSASLMGITTSLGSSKVVLSRDSHLEGLLFHDDGGN